MNQLTTTAPLNVRTSPSMDGTIIGSFPAGTAVNVLSVEGDWYQVKYNDTTAYVSSEYLR
ncbi:SH3 domain-containing protein [Eggerthella sinensis]|uniref:SH3 domain-containing protein n=1 Tax=Eggerthella sinensis TaxID=242230 RepID=UPI0022E48F83|nr:SH3 domain-containing protein [Eggerthella sinensis]